MKRGSLEAAAEMAGISYAHARRLMSRTELSEHIELKKIPLQLGAVMDREERLRWLSDMIRDPSVGGRVQLGAMECSTSSRTNTASRATIPQTLFM
jgi:hypothetical protein